MVLTDLSDYITFTFEIANDSLNDNEWTKTKKKKNINERRKTKEKQTYQIMSKFVEMSLEHLRLVVSFVSSCAQHFQLSLDALKSLRV